MPKIYKTALGRTLDIETLKLQNETVIAVGNQRVNARGDEIDSNGTIVKTRDQQMAEHYRAQGYNVPRDEPIYQNKSHAKENSVTEDYIDAKKLHDVIADLTKQLAEKDAQLSKNTVPENPTVEEESNMKVVEPNITSEKILRGGLASAIQKDLEYKAKTTSTKNKRI